MNQSLAGNLLVASSSANHPLVNQSVCLLVHHDSDGAIGVMLNRPMEPNVEQLRELFEQQSSGRAAGNRLASEPSPGSSSHQDSQRRLHFGGPLSGPLVAIHTSSEHAEAETGPGIYVAAQKQHLEHFLHQDVSPYRLIVGHLGWSADQLGSEIAEGIWHVVPATADVVFAAEAEMWPLLIRRATARSVASWLGLRDDPDASVRN